MSNTDWLKELKAGDKVIVSNRYGSTVMDVEKVTATQIVVKDGRRWRKDGRLVGRGTWDTDSLKEATPEAVAVVESYLRREKLIGIMETRDWRKIPLDKLERIAAILNESD